MTKFILMRVVEISEFFTRILSQLLLQLLSDGLAVKGSAFANQLAGQVLSKKSAPMKRTRQNQTDVESVLVKGLIDS